MENRKPIKQITCVILAFYLLAPSYACAYSINTHKLLTDEIVKLFEHNYPDQNIGETETAAIIKGSADEDEPFRFLNHFYDPITGQGLSYAGEWQNSKDWSIDTIAQATFGASNKLDAALYGNALDWFSGERDYSWDRAVYEYAWGNKERGLEALGHNLHLIEDMAVPEHTRNDPHPNFEKYAGEIGIAARAFEEEQNTNSSPYEIYTSQFGIGSQSIAQKLIAKNKKPAIKNNLDWYFVDEATYTNHNFFSRDTIEKYKSPNAEQLNYKSENLSDGADHEFGYSNNNIKLIEIIRFRNKQTGHLIKTYQIDDIDHEIMSDYWKMLSEQAVLNGAGVIKLFFDEVEKEKTTKTLYNKNRSWVGKKIDGLKNTVFGLANIFYGISVTPEDIAEDQSQPTSAIPPAKQNPTPQSQTQPLIPPSAASNNIPNPPATTTESPEPPIPIPQYTNTLKAPETYHDYGGGREEPPAPVITTQTNATNQTNDNDNETDTNTQATTTAPAINESETATEENAVATTTDTVTADTTPPKISLTIEECLSSLAANGCLIATTTIHIYWQTTAADLDIYELTYDGTTSTTTATSTTLTLSDNAVHAVAVRAKDITGNWSDSQETEQEIEISTTPVVINEVAWMGTSAKNSKDEWIELYNRTGKSVNLTNWQLYSETDKGPNLTLVGIIQSKNYYLIERTDDNAISDIPADLAASFGNGLGNNGEQLVLAYTTNNQEQIIIDQNIKLDRGWPAGDDQNYFSMERIDPDISGMDQTNWSRLVYPIVIWRGHDADGNPINGTPGARNSVNYLIPGLSGTLNSDKTITAKNSPYISNGFAIASGATLTIESGVVIKFTGNGSITSYGKIIANGTAESPIIFTSIYDDEYGGDINYDGASTTPTARSWSGIVMREGSDGSSFSNTIFRYGGDSSSNLSVENADIAISSSLFEHSTEQGVKLWMSNSSVLNNTFQNHSGIPDTTKYGTGIYAFGGAPNISGNLFQNNGFGLTIDSAQATVDSNMFENNNHGAIYSGGELSSFTNNSGTNNSPNGIIIYGQLAKTGESAILQANALPYIPASTARIASDTTITIESGAVFKMTDSFSVYGVLNISGDSPSGVVFTSLYDDSVAGDTDNGSLTGPAPGQWPGIKMQPGSALNASGFTIRYGGTIGSEFVMGGGALTLDTAYANISNALFQNNYRRGLEIKNSEVSLTNTIFQDHNFRHDAGAGTAVSFYNSTATLDGVSFINNALGALGDAASLITASNIMFSGNTANASPADLFGD